MKRIYGRPWPVVLLVAAIDIAFPALVSAQAADEAAKQDMLCANAPPRSVEPIPALLSDWVVVLCTPTGQALAPEIKKKTLLWIAQPSGQPFMLEAAPRSFQKPASLSKYDLRFTSIRAGERVGADLENILKIWDAMFQPRVRPKIERVVELDAISAWEGTGYRLFFYFVNKAPRWIVACGKPCIPIQVVELP